MKFKFKLASVLSYTLSSEEIARQEYLKFSAQQKEARDRMELLRMELVKEADSKNINISLLLIRSSYNEKVKQQLQQQIELIAVLEKKIQGSKTKMIEILKERKTLEKLKDKHYVEYQKHQSILEQKFLDEQALIAFRRN